MRLLIGVLAVAGLGALAWTVLGRRTQPRRAMGRVPVRQIASVVQRVGDLDYSKSSYNLEIGS